MTVLVTVLRVILTGLKVWQSFFISFLFSLVEKKENFYCSIFRLFYSISCWAYLFVCVCLFMDCFSSGSKRFK